MAVAVARGEFCQINPNHCGTCIFVTLVLFPIDFKTCQYLDFLPPARFWKTAGGIVLGSVAVSADVLPYISVAIKASFLKLGMRNTCKNNIAKMFSDFFKILNCSFDRGFLNFW